MPPEARIRSPKDKERAESTGNETPTSPTTENHLTLADFLVKAVRADLHQNLTVGQRNILGLRYGADLSLEQIGRRLQVTKENVRQIENRAWKRLLPRFPLQEQREIEVLLKNRARETTMRMWENPDFREKMDEALKRQWQDPVYKEMMSARLSEAMNKWWQNPKFRAKMIRAQRKRRKREKAARLRLSSNQFNNFTEGN